MTFFKYYRKMCTLYSTFFYKFPYFLKNPFKSVWEISYFFGGDSGVQSKPEKIWKLASKEKRGSYIAIKE